MTPSLQHFETFILVAETSSFTAAAKKLGHSKSSVSQAIRSLESILKLPLFIRSTRSVILTPEGILLFEQCKRLEYELTAARNIVNGFHTSPTGNLKISCNPFFAESHLLDILQKYTSKYPDVTIELLAEERIPNMQKENIDVVFGVNWQPPEDVVAKQMGSTRYVLCASPTYLKQFGIPKTIKALEQHRYIPHGKRSVKTTLVGLKNPPSFLNVKKPLILNDTHLMIQCALRHMGIIEVHDYKVKDELASGSLIELLPKEMNESLPLYMYYQKHRFVQPKIRAFVNLCSFL